MNLLQLKKVFFVRKNFGVAMSSNAVKNSISVGNCGSEIQRHFFQAQFLCAICGPI